jgi:hypothetical protein
MSGRLTFGRAEPRRQLTRPKFSERRAAADRTNARLRKPQDFAAWIFLIEIVRVSHANASACSIEIVSLDLVGQAHPGKAKFVGGAALIPAMA